MTKSVELSSYKTKNSAVLAQQLGEHPLVRQEIETRFQERSRKSEVKAEYLINKLMKIIENTETDNPQAALRGIELLGKSIAFWKDRQEISGPDGEAIKHEQHVKESVNEFTDRISTLAERNGNVVPIRK